MKCRVILLITVIFFCTTCREKKPLFTRISSQQSSIFFNNRIVESDSINPFDVTNMYNGAGVGIGDFNNDGLQDIYFTGNQVACKLYLNKGNFRFRDVTSIAKVDGTNKWCRGVAIVDINNDGWLDIYVCATIYSDPVKRENLLYINQGLNKDKVPVFREMAKEYGLNDNSNSTMAYFFDYDNDGDLDVYIVVNEIRENENPSVYRPILKDGSSPSTGRLYRNDFNASLNHPVFTNVSKEAGITIEGYGHSACIADINRDGWKDIFVANDFLSNDILYVNNHDGTFTDKAASYFKHTSANGMGSDVIDINNDGLADVIEVDMDPEDNQRKKVLMSGYNYQNYNNNRLYGYQYQYVRNTLQVNLGNRPTEDSPGDPVFGEIGYFAGISSTDWSWTPLVQDFDNDGLRDLVITNGFPKDLTDHDFISFREKSFGRSSKSEVLSKIPQQKILKYGFRNNGDLTFKDVSALWGLNDAAFSNGAAYADLDNDGDLDIVMSNINDEAFIYRNNLLDNGGDSINYIDVRLTGNAKNKNATGAIVNVYYAGKMQTIENTPYRGYLSTVQGVLHFGLGNPAKIDSVIVWWPDNKKQVITDVSVNSVVKAYQKDAAPGRTQSVSVNPLFRKVTASTGITYLHDEPDFVDFDIQKLIPHKLSEYSPGLAAGDVNGDGLDDIVCGGSVANSTVIFIQKPDGTFSMKKLFPDGVKKKGEDMGIALFDADNDGDADLYIACGGNEYAPGAPEYADKLMINDGKGNFSLSDNALPENNTSKSCVRPFDFDNDGDLDLFIAGRLYPWNYPKQVSSFIYRNESLPGKPRFVDVTDSVAGNSLRSGLVCDALWTDFDNDGFGDLVIAGEWSTMRFLKNDHGKFRDISAGTGLDTLSGWWNSLTQGDFDNDGDVDYIACNLGGNSFYTANHYPVSIYYNDFYKQGTVQCIITKYMRDKPGGTFKEFTTHNRDDVIEQLPFIKKRFLTYHEYAKASFEKVFTPEELKASNKLSANFTATILIRNDGNGKFTIQQLPGVAQYSAINGMVVDDFDNDGNLDIVFNTNDYSTEPANGRYDALNGLMLKGNGDCTFTPLSIAESGIFIPGNGRALVKLRGANNSYLLAASQNRGQLEIFRLRNDARIYKVEDNDIKVEILLGDNKKQLQILDNGNSFLSQSSRFIMTPSSAKSVRVLNNLGNKRELIK